MAFEQEAKKFTEALMPKESTALTIKLVSGTIESVGANHSTAVVNVGDSRLRVLNKSGEQLMAGESVWLGYIKSLADAVIWFRCGLSTPPNGGE